MMTRNFHVLSLFVLAWTAGISSADAGVKGSFFKGAFENNLGDTADCTLNFRNNNTFTLTQDFGSGVQSFHGDYTEIDLWIISFWEGTVADPTPDGLADTYGISLFGLLATLRIDNLDISITADGLLLRDGPAFRSAPAAKGTGSAGTK